MAVLLTDEHRAWIGRTEAPLHIEVNRTDIIKYAVSTEQRRQKYLAGDEAPPMFVFGLVRPVVPIDQLGPDGLAPQASMPDLPLKRIMAGGTKMRLHRPIRPGDKLVATRRLADLYEKEGRQGPLIFMVNELNVVNQDGEPVIDEIQTRIVR
ncbi:MAG: acyl dehydratase [Chromatiales bacterium]|nr:acyl dehydratase [Chromatiales bacterium]